MLVGFFLIQSYSLFALTEKTSNPAAALTEDSARVLEIPFEESPYPVILTRMPFGAPPDPNAQAATAATMDEKKIIEEQNKLAASFSWTAINITPEGKTAIGFTDLTPNKTPESYYITVGESANNWKLIQADYASETATIEKDGIQIKLKFGNKSPISPTAAATPSPGGGLAAPPSSGTSRISPFRKPPVNQPHTSGTEAHVHSTPPSSTLSVASYRERLAERMKAQESLRQESERKQKEELSKIVTDALQKQQEEAAAAAALQAQETAVAPEGQPVEAQVQ